MNTIRLIFSIIAVLAFIVWIFGGLRFTSSPFSISIPQWRTALAVMCFLVGGILIYKDGIRQGIRDCSKYIIEHLKDTKDEK